MVFTLTAHLDRRSGEQAGRGGADFVVQAVAQAVVQPLGRVVIDVRAGAARWELLPAGH